MNWTLDIDQDRLEVNDADELRIQLLRLHRQAERQPVIALLNAPDGASLGIGLGLPRSVLNYLAPGGWPAKHTVGDEADGLVAYRLAGQVSEMPARCSVPFEDAVDAAVRFFDTGKLDEKLQWEDD